jgi:hypothetical protein
VCYALPGNIQAIGTYRYNVSRHWLRAPAPQSAHAHDVGEDESPHCSMATAR